MTDSHRTSGGPSALARGLTGAAACGIAAVPLAAALTLFSGIFGDPEGLVEIVLVFLAFAVFGSLIAAVMGLLVGLPLYLLLDRMGALRLDVFMLLGAAGGFAVFSLWIGVERARENWHLALGFIMCGVFSSLAFSLGAKKAKA